MVVGARGTGLSFSETQLCKIGGGSGSKNFIAVNDVPLLSVYDNET